MLYISSSILLFLICNKFIEVNKLTGKRKIILKTKVVDSERSSGPKFIISLIPDSFNTLKRD